MIRKGKGQFSEMGKAEAFLEFSGPELYNALPSPRILNTHNEFDWLPEKVIISSTTCARIQISKDDVK